MEERVIVRFIVGSSRIFAGLWFGCVCTVAGCGNLIGLGGYSVTDDSAGNGNSQGGTGNVSGVTGRAIEAGSAGESMGEGGTGGAPEGDSGAAGASGAVGASGAADIAGSAGTSGTVGTSGSAGASGGAPTSCPGGCDDGNDCTADSCVRGACTHAPLAVGAACGVSRSCDGQAVCVRCRDTAGGTAQDLGCSPTAPICLGTGLAAACAGCTAASDCNDGNECTTEACSGGKCVFATAAAGSGCAAGVCNGSAGRGKVRTVRGQRCRRDARLRLHRLKSRCAMPALRRLATNASATSIVRRTA